MPGSAETGGSQDTNYLHPDQTLSWGKGAGDGSISQESQRLLPRSWEGKEKGNSLTAVTGLYGPRTGPEASAGRPRTVPHQTVEKPCPFLPPALFSLTLCLGCKGSLPGSQVTGTLTQHPTTPATTVAHGPAARPHPCPFRPAQENVVQVAKIKPCASRAMWVCHARRKI